jgi:translation initiation factor 5A
MNTKPIEVGNLKIGSYVVVDGVACTVKSIQISRPGKHGHAKSRIEAVAMMDGQVISVTDDSASIMDLKSFETFDLKIPKELKDDVKDGVNVIYWVILKDKVMKQVKKE